MKRIVKLIVTMTLLLSMSVVLFANGGKEKAPSDGMLELSVELFDRANVPQSEGSLEDNRWTRWIKEEMKKEGVNVTFFPVPRSEETQKLNTLMASGTAPDLVFTYNRLLFSKFASNGGLQDLAPAIDEFGPNIQEKVGKPGILKYGFVSGAQYGVPAIRGATAHKNEAIRIDWLEKVGMDVPTNLDELVNVLKAFRDAPAGTFGVDKVIPFGNINKANDFESHMFGIFNLMLAFQVRDDKADITTPAPLREGFKEFMAFMNMLYTEKLIDPEFSTDTPEIADSKITNGNVGFISGAHWLLTSDNNRYDYATLRQIVPGAVFRPVEVFQNVHDGNYYKTHYPPVGLYLFSPKVSNNAEAVVKYINWQLKDDVTMIQTFGIEGEHYEMKDGIPVVIDPDHNKQTFNYISGDLRLPWNGYPRSLGEEMLTKLAIPAEWPEYKKVFAAEGNRINDSDKVPEVLFNTQISSEEKNMPQLSAIYEEYWIKMIVADDFESVYSEFMEAIEVRGINDILAERTEYYNNL